MENTNTDNKQEFPVGVWISLYSGGTLTFNSDSTLLLDENPGTWTQEGTCLTLNYTVQSNGNSIEMYYDILEENGITFLKSQKVGIINGNTSNISINEYYPEDKIDEVKNAVSKNIGDVVSTDIIELTVNKAELSYYAVGASTIAGSGKTANIDEACSPSESGGFYKTNKGNTLVCLDFTLTNTDRSSLNTDNHILSFTVTQNRNSSTVNGYDLNNADGSYGLDLFHMPISINGQDFITNTTSNEIIDAGDTIRIKYVGVIGFDADLSAAFDLVVRLDNSNCDKEIFVYTVE